MPLALRAVLVRLLLVLFLAWAVPWIVEALRAFADVPVSHGAVVTMLTAVYLVIAVEDVLRRRRSDSTGGSGPPAANGADQPVESTTGQESLDDDVSVVLLGLEPERPGQL